MRSSRRCGFILSFEGYSVISANGITQSICAPAHAYRSTSAHTCSAPSNPILSPPTALETQPSTSMTTIRTSCASLAALALLLINAPVQADLLNLSTRTSVGTGENVLIGSFTITGTAPMPVIIRAIGPSMSGAVLNVLLDPMLDLFKVDNKGGGWDRRPFQSADDWRNAQELETEATRLAPTNDYEAAIIVKLAPGSYSAVVRGYAHSSGMALIDVHGARTSVSRLTQLSSRGHVQTGDEVLIGGFTVSGDTRILLRAIGPTLGKRQIADPLSDTTLELRDANGLLLEANDDWRSDNEQAIRATGLAPTDYRESAILRTLPSGIYTAIVRGKDNKTGIALVEVYRLPSFSIEPPPTEITFSPILPFNPQMRGNDVTDGFPVTLKH
jgi:hypothetical protein